MRNSDIFDSFVKIAQEKGLISEDKSQKTKKQLENNPRADSLSISDIEILYGVKPDAPKEMQYKHNIIENAHPNSVIIAPSYDKLNGLVENENERQNINLNIVNKTPNGHLTQHKYAEHQLLMSLIKAGNVLNNEELKKLNNNCIDNICEKKVKIAAAPAVLLPVAAVLGGVWLQQHLPMADQGYEENYNNLIAELNDFLTSSAEWGVGTTYTEEFKKIITDFKNKLEGFNSVYKRVKPVILDLEKPRDAKELLAISNSAKSTTVINAHQLLFNLFERLKPYLVKIQDNFKNASYKARQIKEKGILTKVVDWTQVLHSGKGLIADDFDDVSRALVPFIKSVEEMLDLLEKSKSVEDQAKQDLERFQSQVTEQEEAPELPSERQIKELDEEAGSFKLPEE